MASILSAPSSIDEGQIYSTSFSSLTQSPTEAVISSATTGNTYTVNSSHITWGGSIASFPFPPLLAASDYQVVWHLSALDGGGTLTSTGLTVTNSYPYSDTPGITDSNSVLHGQFLGSSLVELKIIKDADAALMTINWSQMNTDGTWNGDVSFYTTVVSGATGSTTVTIGVLFSDGTTGSFDVTIQIGGSGLVNIVDRGKLLKPLIRSLITGLY